MASGQGQRPSFPAWQRGGLLDPVRLVELVGFSPARFLRTEQSSAQTASSARGLAHDSGELGLGKGATEGIDRLGMAMLIALAISLPIGFSDAAVAFRVPELLGAGIVVGICSSVIPYVCDQFAMARLPRSSFALMLALLPATATVIGIVVLRQFPTPAELVGVGLVIIGVALHQAEK